MVWICCLMFALSICIYFAAFIDNNQNTYEVWGFVWLLGWFVGWIFWAKIQAFFSPLSHRKLSSLFPSIFNSLLNSVFHQNMRLKLYHVVCPTHGHCVLVGCIPFLIFVSREQPLCPKVLYVYFAHCAVIGTMSLSSYSFSLGFEGFSSSCVTS